MAHHYHHFGGVSPINAQCRELLAALRPELAAAGVDLPLYWGNRNWDPYLADTVAPMRDDGVQRALAFVTSPFGSYSSCRQYLDDIEAARARSAPARPAIDKIRHYHDHPGYVRTIRRRGTGGPARTLRCGPGAAGVHRPLDSVHNGGA